MIHEPSLRTLDTRELLRRLARTRSSVSRQRYAIVVIRAQRERAIIERACGEKDLGANEGARERALILALADDQVYQSSRRLLATIEEELALLEAEWDARRYELRCREVAAAERRTEAAAWAIVNQLEDE